MASNKELFSEYDTDRERNEDKIHNCKTKWHKELCLIFVNLPFYLLWICITILRRLSVWSCSKGNGAVESAALKNFDDEQMICVPHVSKYTFTTGNGNDREQIETLCGHLRKSGNELCKALWAEALNILERNDHKKTTLFLEECNALPSTSETNSALAYVCTATLSYENEAAWSILSNMRKDALVAPIRHGICHGLMLLHCAVINNKKRHVQLILERFESNTKDLVNTIPELETVESSLRRSPLLLSIAQRDTAMAQLLIKFGADLSQTDAYGNNALHIAVLEGKDDHEVAETLFDGLMSGIEIWMQCWLTFEDENLLTQRYKESVAKLYLTRFANLDGLTPLTLATKHGIKNIVSKLLNLDGVYSFKSQRLGMTNQTLFDMSEIDPLCMQGGKRCSILELLATKYNSNNLSCLTIPVICNAIQLKRGHYLPFLASLGIFHLLFVIFFNVTAYNYLFPRNMKSFNTSTGTTESAGHRMFEFTVIDYLVMSVCCSYTVQAVVTACAIWQLTKKTKLTLRDMMYTSTCMDLCPSLVFAFACGTYLILKEVNSEICVYFLAVALLVGWMRALMLTKIIRKLAFFSIMYTSVLSGEIFSFLFIILGLVVAYSVAACCIFFYEAAEETSNSTENISERKFLHFGNVMLAYTQLAVGISDFSYLSESSNWFNYFLYIMFLIGANVVLFNVLLAAISNEYNYIAERADFLCQQVLIRDLLVLESMLPQSLQMPVTKLYNHKRIKLPCKHNGSKSKSGPSIDLYLRRINSITG